MIELADLLFNGIKVEVDEKRAFEIYSICAKDNILSVYNGLGCCYSLGKGVDKDEDKAFENFEYDAKRDDAKRRAKSVGKEKRICRIEENISIKIYIKRGLLSIFYMEYCFQTTLIKNIS